MKFFKFVRLSLWCGIVAVCIVIVLLNYSVSQITNDPAALQGIARSANTYEIVRDDILTPRILKEAQDAGYTELVDAQAVRVAVDKSFDDTSLDTLLAPATESLSSWLASKQPDATFRVEARQQLNKLTDTLATTITAKILAQPACSYWSTSADVATGQCHLSTLTEQDIRTGIVTALQSQPTIKDGVLSSDQLAIPDSVVEKTRNIPEYLNMLNSAAIFAAGILVLSTLWLLLKHRLAGIATLGISGLIAALGIYVAQNSFVAVVNSYALEPGYQELAHALAQATATEIRTLLWPLAGISALLAILGSSGWFALRRRRLAQDETVRVRFDARQPKDPN